LPPRKRLITDFDSSPPSEQVQNIRGNFAATDSL
jgi:hypothetical protein